MNKVKHRLKRWKNQIERRFQTDIYYVTDAGGWVFDTVAQYLAEGVPNMHRTTSPWDLKHQIIHFGDRYGFLHEAAYQKLHLSNTILLTWYHGEPDDPNPNIRQLFDELPHALPLIHQIVTSCQISKTHLISRGVLPEKVQIIPLGVDLTHFKKLSSTVRQQMRRELNIPDNAFCIGFFQKDGQGWQGEGNEPKLEKGPDVFLEVIQILARQHNNLRVLLTGPARGYVKNGLEKIGVPYVHRYLEDYHEIANYYQALDCYLIASRSEGGPLSLLESWACGVPVVSTRMGMPADLIQHGQNGLLAEVEDVAELAKHVSQLIENAPQRAQLSQQALLDVQNYDWSIIARQHYEKLYAPILSK